MGIVGACSGPSGAPSVATVPPNHCPRTVPSNAQSAWKTSICGLLKLLETSVSVILCDSLP